MEPTNELHYHECPTTGCHKQWTCTEAGCGPFYFKSCEAHEIKPPAPAAPPPVAEVAPPSEPGAPADKPPDPADVPASVPTPEVAPPSEPVAPTEPTAPGDPATGN